MGGIRWCRRSSAYRSTFGVVSLGVLLLATIVPSSKTSAEDNVCSSPSGTPAQLQNSEAEWWTNSKTLISRANSTVADLRSFYFLGDTIRLNAKNFPHLAVDPRTALTKLEKIVIDAREVIIDMPIHLASGRVEIHADKVTFTPNGYFAFYNEPRQDGEGIYILARYLDVSAFAIAKYLPFHFVTTNHTWSGGLFRRISIIAAEVVGPLAGLEPAAAREKLYFSTLDPESGLIPSGDGDLAKRFEIRTGVEVLKSYYASIKAKQTMWPVRFAEAARDFQFRFPFNPTAEIYVRKLIHDNREAIANSPDDGTNAIIQGVLNRYAWQQDGLGSSAYYVPRETLETLQSNLSNNLTNTLDLASDWLAIHLESLKGNGLDPKLLNRETTIIDHYNKQVSDSGDQIESFFSQSASVNQEAAATDDRITAASQRLRQELEEQIKKQKQAAEIKAAGTALSYAAALLPGGVAIQVGVSTLTLAGSHAVAGNQLGGASRIDSVGDLATLLAVDAKSARENIDTVRGMQCDWRRTRYLLNYAVNKESTTTDLKASGSCVDEVKRPTGSGLSELGVALKNMGESGQKARERFLAQLGQGSPADPSLTQLAVQDSEYQGLIATRQGLATKLGQLEDGRQKAQQRILQLGGQIASSKARIEDALAANLDQDAGRPLLGAIALGATQENLQSIVTQLNLLERAFAYHTGQSPSSPSGVTLAAIQGAIRLILDQADGGSHLQMQSAGAPDLNATALTIKTGLATLRLQIQQFLADIHIQHEAFINRTGQIQQFSLSMPYSQPHAITSQNISVSKFIESINNTLRAQVREGSNIALVALPSQRWDGAFGKRERLIGIKLDLHFRDIDALQGRSFEVRILHPRFGKIHTLSGCQFFDFRSDRDIDQYDVFTTTCDSDGACKPSSMFNLPAPIDRENQKRTFLPVDTNYLLQIIMQGGQVSELIPIVDKVTVTTSVLR